MTPAPGVEVRRIRPAEAAQLRELRLAMLLDAPDAFASRHQDEAAEPLTFWDDRARLSACGDRVATFVAVEQGLHLGSATGLWFDHDGPALLVAMWVRPAQRGCGLGLALADAVCGWAERIGADHIELDVREHNHAAIALYRRAGFAVTAGPHPAEAAPQLNELRMARRLDRPPDGPVVGRLRRTLDASPDVVAALEALPAPDLHALMLHLARVRACGRRPADLLAERSRLEMLEPAPVALELLLEVEAAALGAAGGFTPVELSPIAPGATNAVLGGLDQNLTLATARGSEVLADPTTSLALEVALERRRGTPAPALCARARVLRMQRFGGGWRQHFGLFALASGGRAAPGDGFALRALLAHLTVYLGMLRQLAERGHAIGAVTVEVSDGDHLAEQCRAAGVDVWDLAAQARAGEAEPEAILAEAGIELPRFGEAPPAAATRLERVAEHVYGPLAAAFPGARLGFRPGRLAAIGYYRGLLLNVDAEFAGTRLSIADGGTVDWTQRLLSDRRERLLVSGIGSERVARLMGPRAVG